MDRAEVSKKIKQIVAEKLGVAQFVLRDEMTFVGDLGVDSLDATDIVLEIEKEFGVQLSDAEGENMTTIGKAVDLIGKKMR